MFSHFLKNQGEKKFCLLNRSTADVICDISTLLGEGGQFDHTNFMLRKILEWPFPGYRLFSTKYFWALTSHRNLTPKNFGQFGPWIRIFPSSSPVNHCGDKFWVKRAKFGNFRLPKLMYCQNVTFHQVLAKLDNLYSLDYIVVKLTTLTQ